MKKPSRNYIAGVLAGIGTVLFLFGLNTLNKLFDSPNPIVAISGMSLVVVGNLIARSSHPK